MGVLRPRTTSHLVYHGDDMELLAELRRAVMRAEAAVEAAEERAEQANRGPRRGGDEIVGAEAERAALEVAQQDYDAAVDEAAERAVDVRLEAIGSRRFRELLAEHEPREDHELDGQFGVNTDTFPAALLLFRDETKRTVTFPDLARDDLREFIEDELAGDFDDLWVKAYWLNKAQGVDPRLGKYSTGTPTLPVN